VFTLQLPNLSINTRYTFPVSVFSNFAQNDSSFSRALIVESANRDQQGVSPISFRYFIGIFFIAVLGFVIIAILRRW